jgi:HSP20 family protein
MFINLKVLAPVSWPVVSSGYFVKQQCPAYHSGEVRTMPKREFTSWMWFEAVDRLSRAQRLHQQFFTLREHGDGPAWEPPADVLETETEVLIFFALPGVDPESVDTLIEGGTLIVSGRRVLPEELRRAHIHQLELPQGRFERRVPLPASRYDAVKRQAINGCLLISLHKLA